MCNLYRTRQSLDEIARLFRAELLEEVRQANVASEVYPGTPGPVLFVENGVRELKVMSWGFPLTRRSKRTGKPLKPKPVNNARNLESPFWKSAAANPGWRCLIPVSEFAEAEGPSGKKTRTWFSITEEPVFAWAGLWRPSEEWGNVYSGVMTEANDLVSPVHDRMPVILAPEDHDKWLFGSFEDVLALQRPCDPDRMQIERTDRPWNAGR